MKKYNCVIVIPTHSSYIDVVINFLLLFKKYWNDCKYEIIVGLTGENINLPNCKIVYCGENCTLPSCIYTVSKEYDAEYYICFLGDAFLNSKVDSNLVEIVLNIMKKNKLNYLRIFPIPTLHKTRKVTDYVRVINSGDRYAHTFIAFVASGKFINDEFSDGKTDFEFENKYLELVRKKPHFYFNDHAVVTKKIFDIYPGIVKGKWERHVYRLMKRSNPEMNFDTRDVLSVKDNLYYWSADFFIKYMPDSIRIFIKRLAKGKLTVTKN